MTSRRGRLLGIANIVASRLANLSTCHPERPEGVEGPDRSRLLPSGGLPPTIDQRTPFRHTSHPSIPLTRLGEPQDRFRCGGRNA
jgi:hypothetical protein